MEELEDPSGHPSLSDFYDHEPNLEFDDSDLHSQHTEDPVQGAQAGGTEDHHNGKMTSRADDEDDLKEKLSEFSVSTSSSNQETPETSLI